MLKSIISQTDGERDLDEVWKVVDRVDAAINASLGTTFGNVLYIQDKGNKELGKVYIDKNDGKLYKCIQNTTYESNVKEYFKEFNSSNIYTGIQPLQYYDYQTIYNIDKTSADGSFRIYDCVIELRRKGKIVTCEIRGNATKTGTSRSSSVIEKIAKLDSRWIPASETGAQLFVMSHYTSGGFEVTIDRDGDVNVGYSRENPFTEWFRDCVAYIVD